MSLTEKYKDCTIKYLSTSLKENDHIQIIYPADENGKGRLKCVPISSANSDYVEIQEWVNEGNTIGAAD